MVNTTTINAANSQSAPSNIRKPRIRAVLPDGTTVPGLISASVDSNNGFHADQFTAKFALWADRNYGPRWWKAQQVNVFLVSIQMGFADDKENVTWTELILGEGDNIEVDISGGIVELIGMDLTKRLIKNKTNKNFQNVTASQAITQIAQLNNMIADVDATTDLVGRYYNNIHTQINDNGELSKTQAYWDVCVFLAKSAKYDLWVTGKTLHFKKPTADTKAPRQITMGAVAYGQGYGYVPYISVNNLKLHRNLEFSKDFQVVVNSYSTATEKAIKKTAGAYRSNSSKSDVDVREYIFPNLTADQAQQKAQQIMDELAKHECKISWEEPGDLTLSIRDSIQLSGTNNGQPPADDTWDQKYYVSTITRHVDIDEGFKQFCTAKHYSAQRQFGA